TGGAGDVAAVEVEDGERLQDVADLALLERQRQRLIALDAGLALEIADAVLVQDDTSDGRGGHGWPLVSVERADVGGRNSQPSASFGSRWRSSPPWRPTLGRISPSPTPRARRSSAGMLACVIVAGWHPSDSTPPRLSARANNRVLVRNRRAASAPPFRR